MLHSLGARVCPADLTLFFAEPGFAGAHQIQLDDLSQSRIPELDRPAPAGVTSGPGVAGGTAPKTPAPRLLLSALAGWINRQQAQVVDYLFVKNRVRKEAATADVSGGTVRSDEYVATPGLRAALEGYC